jgi:hypothetical protein
MSSELVVSPPNLTQPGPSFFVEGLQGEASKLMGCYDPVQDFAAKHVQGNRTVYWSKTGQIFRAHILGVVVKIDDVAVDIDEVSLYPSIVSLD